MTGVDLSYDLRDLENVADALNRALGVLSQRELLDVVGAIAESGSRRRIQYEKKDPDGKRWKPWSRHYAQTRHSGHSLLSGEGHLLDSIQHSVDGDSVSVGSNKVYAAIHQFGGAAGRGQKALIPARAYLGLSKLDKEYIADAFKSVVEEAFHAG